MEWRRQIREKRSKMQVECQIKLILRLFSKGPNHYSLLEN